MKNRILIVDDDSYVLQTLNRALAERFDLTLAGSGEEALQAMTDEGPFAVVVCDMNMPGIDGIETLIRIKELAPDTVRMMLTAIEDQKTAMAAINKGHIFHFFQKPCPAKELIEGVEEGVAYYNQRLGEREKSAAKEAYLGNLYRTLTGNEFPGVDETPQAYRIALVADASIDAETLRAYLEEYGHEVIVLTSGREFLDRIEELQAQLLLVGFKTADLEARELSRHLNQKGGRRLPIILLLPPSMSKVRPEVLQGFDDHLRLPCTREDFLAKVENCAVTWDEILPFL